MESNLQFPKLRLLAVVAAVVCTYVIWFNFNPAFFNRKSSTVRIPVDLVDEEGPSLISIMNLGATARYENGHVVSVDIPPDSVADCLEFLTAFPKLNNVILDNATINAVQASKLSQLRDLERLWLTGPCVTDDVLAQLKGMSNLKVLSLRDSKITDDGFVHLSELVGLNVLRLMDTQITGRGLNQLKDLSLTELYLWGTDTDDDGLAQLRGQSEIQILTLEGTHVTDQGLVHLREIPRLEQLNLGNTSITDEGLVVLASMPNLKGIIVSNTEVTADGLSAFQNKCPDCEIH